MNFLRILESKRDGKELSPRELQELVSQYTGGKIPDYQMAAFLMAVHFQGLGEQETRTLTLAMRDSGEVLSFPEDKRPLVDKHSTGGIGDKISLPLAPLLACLGFRVPMISGRGLGITGGTLDKLDSITGFQTSLPRERILKVVQEVGCVICGQTERMVPADRKLYALRDVTGTVPSIPLIVASIMSKKMAEDLQALLLDVKFGAAAFMRGQEDARRLAQAMVRLGQECGVSTRAVLTRMDTPIGRSVGNWLEIKEATRFLEGDKGLQDLADLVVNCAAHLLQQTGQCATITEAQKVAFDCLESDKPREKWTEMLEAQGADLEAFGKKLQSDVTSGVTRELHADRSGTLARCDARVVGEVVRDLGGGRLAKHSALDYQAGIDRLAKPGDRIQAGSILARVHARESQLVDRSLERLKTAFEISDEECGVKPLIAEVIGE